MSDCFDTETFEHHGREFVMKLYYDHDTDPPWENDCGSVDIEQRRRHSWRGDGGDTKRPWERIIHRNRTTVFVVDVRAEYERAHKDGWGLSDDDVAKLAAKLKRTPSRKEIAIESVERNIKHMVGWINDDWRYIGVEVTDVLSGDSDSLWGVDDSDRDYILDVRDDLASGLHPLADADQAAVLGEN